MEIPSPSHSIHPEGEGGGSLRPLAFPDLRVLAAQVLFDIPKGVFNGPAPAVLLDDLGGGGVQVGSEEEVIGFFAFGVATDHQ